VAHEPLASGWTAATLYAAMRSRERTSWAILCGTAASVALLVRPSNLLLALPVLVAFGLSPARYALGLLGALPGGLFAVYVNWRLYGTLPFWQTTGYGSPTQILGLFTADATQPFSIIYFRHHAFYFVLWILTYLGPLVVCAMVLPFSPRGRTRKWTIHAVWFTVLFLPYTVYQPAGDAWWYLRFLLPAFPSLILLATGGLSIWWDYFAPSIRSLPRPLKGAAVIAIMLLSVGWMGTATLRLSLLNQRSEDLPRCRSKGAPSCPRQYHDHMQRI